MKRFFLFLLITLFSFPAFAQKEDIKTDTFKVEGNCGMCKKRIEDAAYTKGVKRADWNPENHLLVVTYRASKTNLETIQRNIAKVGHDAGDIASDETGYNKLPDCCQYKTNSCNH